MMKTMTKMKTMAVLTGLALVSSAAAFAGGDQITEVVNCSDLTAQPDNGITISIKSGGLAGLTTADISHDTIVGPQDIASINVKNTSKTIDLANYIGDDFSLDMNFNQPIPKGPNGVDAGFVSHFTADIKGEKFDRKLACRVVNGQVLLKHVKPMRPIPFA